MSLASSLNGGTGSTSGSGRDTPNSSTGHASLAGGLAEALRQRQASMQGVKKEEDEDW